MTQEQKELLLKDICARLPYGVKCSFGVDDAIYIIEGINPNCCGASQIQATHIKSSINGDFSLSSCKPYLFPFSSMTEEQKEELNNITNLDIEIAISHIKNDTPNYITCLNRLNWLLKNHFDIYGIIPMGLANDATDKNIY